MQTIFVIVTIVQNSHLYPALQRISATRAGITAMLEPVLAIVVAWAWLGESLDGVQLGGAAATLAGVALALSSR
jgi:drug/metabolite transporter (DMT)-like permease